MREEKKSAECSIETRLWWTLDLSPTLALQYFVQTAVYITFAVQANSAAYLFKLRISKRFLIARS
jgi:hypothetical protein